MYLAIDCRSPLSLMMDDLIYIGCARSFTIKKSLSIHEVQCPASKALMVDIHHYHKISKRLKKWKQTLSSHSPQPHEDVRFSTPVKIGATQDFLESEIYMTLSDYWLRTYDSQRIQEAFSRPHVHLAPSLPNPVVPGCSGHQIRLPAHYVDYLANELIGLCHALEIADMVDMVNSLHLE